MNKVSEVLADPQVAANQFAQTLRYGLHHELVLVGSPVQFDETPPTLRPAPQFAGDTDEVLGSLGWSQEQILDAKIKGAVV